MGRKNALMQNYFFDSAAVSNLGAEICSVMTQMDGILEEVSGVIEEISALAGSVPSEARCGALLEACVVAQNEIRSVDFLSYGQRVNSGLLNMIGHNAYISDKFIQAMQNNSERAQGFGSGCRSLSALLEYVGGTVALNIKYGLNMNRAGSNVEETEEEESKPLTRSEFIQQMAVKKSGVQLIEGRPHVNGPIEAENAQKYYHYLDEYRNASELEIAAELAGLNHANGIPIINSGFESQKYMEAMEQVKQANSTTLSNFNYHWMRSSNVTYEFLDEVVDISEKLKVSPDDLMATMAFESSFDPQCGDLDSACGLIQFTNISLNEIYRTTGIRYTKKDILNMNAIEQLNVVYLHCKGKGNISTLSDLYMSIICPEAIGKADNYHLYEIGTAEYEKNSGLDLNADGIITKAEATNKVLERRAEYE